MAYCRSSAIREAFDEGSQPEPRVSSSDSVHAQVREREVLQNGCDNNDKHDLEEKLNYA